MCHCMMHKTKHMLYIVKKSRNTPYCKKKYIAISLHNFVNYVETNSFHQKRSLYFTPSTCTLIDKLYGENVHVCEGKTIIYCS